MAAVAAAAVALGDIQEETKCPICLDDLRDPVTTNCGHNFCRVCINQCWPHAQDKFPCPVCRQPCQGRGLRSNTQLGRMIKMAQQLHLSLSHGQETTGLCEKHRQALALFCEQDLELLCALCAGSHAHQGHAVRPVEEAASHHREALLHYSEGLKKQVARLQKALEAQDRQRVELREQVHSQRQQLSSEFEYLTQVVEQEQKAVLSSLVKEEMDMERQFRRDEKAHLRHMSAVQELLAEVTGKSVMSDVKLLTDLQFVLFRCESLKPPAPCSFQLRKGGYNVPPQLSALEKIRQTFAEEVTLDPETAHPDLLVSEDRKRVTFVQKAGTVLEAVSFMPYPVVLGSETFSSGRHYWEVQVDEKLTWTVGVCRAPLSKDRKWPLSLPSRCWAIQMHEGDCVAQSTALLPLRLVKRPRGIGVYLDYDVGEISFYNSNDRSHLHSFRDKFSEALMPYFCIGCDSKPLIISAVRNHEEPGVVAHTCNPSPWEAETGGSQV